MAPKGYVAGFLKQQRAMISAHMERAQTKVLTMDKLKPCPFCGAVMGCSEFIYPTGYKVWKLSGYHTYDCVFKVNFYRPENPNKRTLVSAWNRRVNDD